MTTARTTASIMNIGNSSFVDASEATILTMLFLLLKAFSISSVSILSSPSFPFVTACRIMLMNDLKPTV